MNTLSVPNPFYKGKTTTVTGSGFTPGEQVTLFTSPPEEQHTETADENGDISWDVTPHEDTDVISLTLDPDAGWQEAISRHVVTRW